MSIHTYSTCKSFVTLMAAQLDVAHFSNSLERSCVFNVKNMQICHYLIKKKASGFTEDALKTKTHHKIKIHLAVSQVR